MPSCGCFHNHELELISRGEYRLFAALEGRANLRRVLESTDLASSVTGGSVLLGTTINLSGVTCVDSLVKFCDQLESTIIIDLTPDVDFCHALGPYTIFDDNENRRRTDIGDLLNKAKYSRDPDASGEISAQLSAFIDNHPGLRNITAITTPPESDPTHPNLAKIWAQELATAYSWELLTSNKTRVTAPQKVINDGDTEADVVNRIANSVDVNNVQQGAQALLLDDMIGSGGTLIELGRVLKRAGAAKIFGLAAAKDALYTNGGINLRRNSWP